MLHYLNNAGAGLMSARAYNTVCDFLRMEMGVGRPQAGA